MSDKKSLSFQEEEILMEQNKDLVFTTKAKCRARNITITEMLPLTKNISNPKSWPFFLRFCPLWRLHNKENNNTFSSAMSS